MAFAVACSLLRPLYLVIQITAGVGAEVVDPHDLLAHVLPSSLLQNVQFKQRPADSERAGRLEAAAEARRGAQHIDGIGEPASFPGPLIRNLREGERRAAKGGQTLRYVPLETVELVPREPVWLIPDIQRHEGIECIRDRKESGA